MRSGKGIFSRVWAWGTACLAIFSVGLTLSLLSADQKETLLVVTSCMLGVPPVILFHLYRRDMLAREKVERALEESERR